MIDPRTTAVPVLPAVDPPPIPIPAKPPRYLTVPGPNGINRVVRIDGRPLGYVPERPERAPDPRPETLGLRLFAAGALDRVWAAAQRRRLIVPPPVRPPDAPVFTADEIAALRTAAGLSQRALADELGCSRGTVAGWEEGRRVPQPDGARALAAFRARAGAEAMGIFERSGLCRTVWDQDQDGVEIGGESFGLSELVQRAAGTADDFADSGVLTGFEWGGTALDQDGYWQEQVDQYRAATGRRYPPVYRATIRVEAELLGDEETAAYWKGRKGA